MVGATFTAASYITASLTHMVRQFADSHFCVNILFLATSNGGCGGFERLQRQFLALECSGQLSSG